MSAPSPWSAPTPSSPPTTNSPSVHAAGRAPARRSIHRRPTRRRPTGRASGSKSSKSRPLVLVAVVACVALVAGALGAVLGNRIADWMNEPPTRASNAALDVAAPRDPTERRIDVGGVVDHVAPSIVTISTDVEGGHALGTGVIISADGEILTNAHVVNGATSIRVRLAGETEPPRSEPARRGRRQRPRPAAHGGRRVPAGHLRRSRQRPPR